MSEPLRLEVSTRSHTGQHRHNNQDTALVSPLDGEAQLLAVCDGMGGAAGGEVASRHAADAIRAAMTTDAGAGERDTLARRLAESLGQASRQVHALAAERPELCGMGTTATACVVAGRHLILAQVGDSRAYVLRAERLTQVTRDQTLARLLIESGQLAPEDAERFELAHVILQAVGTTPVVEVDLGVVDLCRGDVVLLCSDGLYGPVDEEAIREVLVGSAGCDAAAEALIALANEAGGPDNITCVVARVEGGDLPPPTFEVVARKLALEVAPQLPQAEEPPDEVTAPTVFERLRELLGLKRGVVP